MLSDGVVLFAAFFYMAILFAIAYVGDRRSLAKRSMISNPYVYSLSLAIYCTAWTYYGSVGRAATTGLGFLPIYLGPTLMAALWWFVLRKIVRIAKRHRITSLADFIGSRYGKSASLTSLVTVICVIGILPYISLQLKAVAASYAVIQQYPEVITPQLIHSNFWQDTAFYIALLLAAFTIMFGTRQLDATEHHEGMVAAIAFESLVKLIAFLAVGIYTTFFLFDGLGALFTQAMAEPALARLLTLEAMPGGYTNWFALLLISMLAVFFLPRQFQVAVVENTDEAHIDKATWLFPLYLLLINLFVLPLALGGLLLFPEGAVDPDTFVLSIPMAGQQEWLTLFVFIGGLSAATSMVIVAAIALSTMICNELIVPLMLRWNLLRFRERADLTGALLLIRRTAIIAILLLAYLYFKLISESYALVSIGLVSFVAAAQFAPAILLGIYWKGANRLGALAGISAGFLLWSYTLFIPALSQSGWISLTFIDEGLWGIALLKPYALMGLDGLDPVSHSVIWSLPVNVLLLVIISVFTRSSPLEKLQAHAFVDVYSHSDRRGGGAGVWRGNVTLRQLQSLVARFIGEDTAQREFTAYAKQRGIDPDELEHMESGLYIANHAEHLLASVVGASNARAIISDLYKGEPISIEDVMEILTETSQVVEYSHMLEQKTLELENTSSELRQANQQLQELDQMKDEFVSTVSHELRTPLTSIRAFSEILVNTPDISAEERQKFLHIIVRESERLTRLINDILDIAKLESGKLQLELAMTDPRDIIQEAMDSVSQLFRDRDMQLTCELPDLPVSTCVDRDRVQQVVINMLSNAAKFCTPGEGAVSVRLSQDDDLITVSVADNGPGIGSDHQNTVFDRFQQVSDQQRGKPKGTGLGLAISKLIIEQHQGTIRVESDGATGSCFVFALPIRDCDDESLEGKRSND